MTPPESPKNKYALRDPIDLRSKYLLQVERQKVRKIAENLRREFDKKQHERRVLERLDGDPYFGFWVHAWVVVIPKISSACKSTQSTSPSTRLGSDSKVFFIEPSTGFRFDADNPNYVAIESVWNHRNYYVSGHYQRVLDASPLNCHLIEQVNCQAPLNSISTMRWDFQNADDWKFVLEENSLQAYTEEDPGADAPVQKYLDMPCSWVDDFHISNSGQSKRKSTRFSILQSRILCFKISTNDIRVERKRFSTNAAFMRDSHRL